MFHDGDTLRKLRSVRGQPAFDAQTGEAADDAVEFIHARDSFYISTISENGWPYIQHRGGEGGFLQVMEPNWLVFADYKGNRQLISTGNVAANDRVALFLMDYPRRIRLKILGHARIDDQLKYPEILARLPSSEIRRAVERLFSIEVVAFDWNCPKHITPRYTAAEFEAATRPRKKP